MIAETPSFLIGKRSSEFLSVAVPRSNARPDDFQGFWDSNWLAARVDFVVGGFRGAFSLSVSTTDFQDFRDDLAELSRSLRGTARFNTIEGQLAIEVEGDGRGHFEARCAAVDDTAARNQVSFTLTFDQTEIPAVVRGIESIIAAHPIRGELDR